MATVSFSGLASGIDSDSLIKATSDAARAQRVTPNQTKVTELTDTNTALDDLTTKLETLQTAAKKFASLNGGGLVKQATSSDETKVSATAANAALNGSYAVTVSTLAKNGTLSLGPSAGTYASDTDTISAGTSQVITIGTGASMETVTVPITAGVTTIAEFVSAFNLQSTKARASLVNVGTTTTPSYRVVINSNKTGTLDGTIAVTTNAAGFATPTASPATDASFSIAGIGSVTRPTNNVSDVIAGLTLSLQAAGTSTVTISDDGDATASLITELVDAWNDVITFQKEKNKVTREESGSDVKNVFSALATTRVDDNVLTSLRSALASTSYSGGSTIRIMADLGITTQRDGTLGFNTDTFKTALADEPVSVNSVLSTFADTISLTGGTIDQYTRFNGMIDVTQTGNTNLITNLNDRIALAEAAILKQEEAMKARFTALETTTSRLQSQQGALDSALAGLG